MVCTLDGRRSWWVCQNAVWAVCVSKTESDFRTAEEPRQWLQSPKAPAGNEWVTQETYLVAPSSFLLLVVRPGGTSSVLAPSG